MLSGSKFIAGLVVVCLKPPICGIALRCSSGVRLLKASAAKMLPWRSDPISVLVHLHVAGFVTQGYRLADLRCPNLFGRRENPL